MTRVFRLFAMVLIARFLVQFRAKKIYLYQTIQTPDWMRIIKNNFI